MVAPIHHSWWRGKNSEAPTHVFLLCLFHVSMLQYSINFNTIIFFVCIVCLQITTILHYVAAWVSAGIIILVAYDLKSCGNACLLYNGAIIASFVSTNATLPCFLLNLWGYLRSGNWVTVHAWLWAVSAAPQLQFAGYMIVPHGLKKWTVSSAWCTSYF